MLESFVSVTLYLRLLQPDKQTLKYMKQPSYIRSCGVTRDVHISEDFKSSPSYTIICLENYIRKEIYIITKLHKITIINVSRTWDEQMAR
jgi:hypothetical protein